MFFKQNDIRIILSSFPKSGSTYISNVLASQKSFKRAILVKHFGHREQELDESVIRKTKGNFISQTHTKYSDATKEIINKYNLKTIILIRNIYDCIVSFKDHISNESIIFPMFYMDHKLTNINNIDLALAKLLCPWYFSFYASWQDYDNKILIKYEELIINEKKLFKKIFNFLNLDFSTYKPIQLDDQLKKNLRINKGVIGRGDELSPEAKEYIEDFAAYFPSYNMTEILHR